MKCDKCGWEWDVSWDECSCYYPDYGSKNRNAPSGVHIMNKDEAKLCRKLMAETGLTEEELREHKKYRVMLSEAQKEGVKCLRGKKQKFLDKIMKGITKELKLAKEHPTVQEAYKKKIKEVGEEASNNPWHRHYNLFR